MIQVRIAKIRTKFGKSLWTVAVVFNRKNDSGKEVRALSYLGRFKSKSEAMARRNAVENQIKR